jgi:hypothetical protein
MGVRRRFAATSALAAPTDSTGGVPMARNVLVTVVVAILTSAATAGAAAVITGAQIKNNSVTGKDIKNKSLTKRDFKGSVRGPRGFQGAEGLQGPKGDPGATTLRVRAATGSDRVTVNCQPGERATGGGAHSVNGFIDASAPAAHPDAIFVSTGITFQEYTPTSWTAHADGAEPPGTPTDVTAWVVCAAP